MPERTPRPYQERALAEVGSALEQGVKRVMICAPTGAGKTTIAAELVVRFRAQGLRVSFLAHRKELIRQPWVRFVRWGIPARDIGVNMPGVRAGAEQRGLFSDDDVDLFRGWARKRPPAPVQIGTIQSAARRSSGPFDVIIIDEAHRALSPQYLTLIERYPDAIVVGLSATPWRTDGRGLGEVFERIIVVASYAELVDQGFLVAPRVWSTARKIDTDGAAKGREDFTRSALAKIGRRASKPELVGDLVEHYQSRGGGSPAMVFASSVEHSKTIAEAFCLAGISAVHVDGSMPAPERDEAFQGLTAGRVKLVSNVDVATEGVDVPCVKCIIWARPTMSLRVWLQGCGRGARPHGDMPFVVLDHAGNAVRHGLPQADREWSLDGRARRTGAAAELPPVWECGICFAAVPREHDTCPECGTAKPVPEREREIRHREGQLVELTGSSGELSKETREVFARDLIAEWYAGNLSRPIPRKPGWIRYEFERRHHGSKWPRSVALPKLTPEQVATIEHASRIRAEAEAKGHDPRSVFAKIASKPVVKRGSPDLVQWTI